LLDSNSFIVFASSDEILTTGTIRNTVLALVTLLFLCWRNDCQVAARRRLIYLRRGLPYQAKTDTPNDTLAYAVTAIDL
jgi:hypothetical protein